MKNDLPTTSRPNGRVVFSEQAEMEEQRRWFQSQMVAQQKTREESNTVRTKPRAKQQAAA
jgi:hypothetical protein